MSERLRTVITFDQASEIFREEYLPAIIMTYELDGIRDNPARYEEWNNFVDALNKDRQISDWQSMNWGHPEWL